MLPAPRGLKISLTQIFTWLCQKMIELDKPTNKTGGLNIYFKIQQISFGFGNRPNANSSASANCENYSFGHSLANKSLLSILSLGIDSAQNSDLEIVFGYLNQSKNFLTLRHL